MLRFSPLKGSEDGARKLFSISTLAEVGSLKSVVAVAWQRGISSETGLLHPVVAINIIQQSVFTMNWLLGLPRFPDHDEMSSPFARPGCATPAVRFMLDFEHAELIQASDLSHNIWCAAKEQALHRAQTSNTFDCSVGKMFSAYQNPSVSLFGLQKVLTVSQVPVF